MQFFVQKKCPRGVELLKKCPRGVKLLKKMSEGGKIVKKNVDDFFPRGVKWVSRMIYFLPMSPLSRDFICCDLFNIVCCGELVEFFCTATVAASFTTVRL